jgi:hypothetical protein
MLPAIYYFTNLREMRGAKNIPKSVLKTKLKTVKYLVVSPSHTKWTLSVLLEYSFGIISGA